jgi:AmmeMemoRadiSam system radical SAM enzyme/AmmeMemoRadiSam system protein B/AmmeMemoRadiSam system protein A
MKTLVANPTLADVLDPLTTVGSLCHAEDERIRCVACGHRCLIGDGKRGICKVRFNEDGRLKVPFGYVAGLQCDPIEKKPFLHVYPGSNALTFGMMGCDLHCSYCQNWVTSQALRDEAATAPVRRVTPAQLVETARREGARLIVSSYNEPLITAEWAVAVFQEAKAAGLACAFVSNGNATPEVLDFLRPWIIAYKVDLKSFDDRHYRSLGGTLDNITDTIRMIHERGIWLEVVTLVVPGFNDDEEELRALAEFIVSVSPDIPWHVTAFHKDYRMTDPAPTSPRTLQRAAEIGEKAGLRFVYAGNLPGQVGHWQNTRCPGCQETLIERKGHLIRAYRLTAQGCCPNCRYPVPGIWPGDVGAVPTGNDQAAYDRRLPRVVDVPRPLSALQSLPLVQAGAPPSSVGGDCPMELTAQQQQHLFSAAGDLVRALAHGVSAADSGVSYGDVGDIPVAGVFVSLKRGKHLRSCCGMLGQPVPLAAALQEAATRTVWDDARFPPVSSSEVERLTMEVWLLHNPEPVHARGIERRAAVQVGRHGIQVVRGRQAGLFLPGVALDNDWDSRRFLDQVCVKAGLPPNSWMDDATALFVFEGEVLRGRLAETNGKDHGGPRRRPGVCRPEDLRAFGDFCLNNVKALLAGMTPNYYFIGAPDGNVTGVILTLQMPVLAPGGRAGSGTDGSHLVHFCQLSLRPGVPLQSTLFTLCQNAAQSLAQQRYGPEALTAAAAHVTILHDATLHGTVGEPELAGIDSKERALLVLERNKSAVVFDPARTAEELLSEASQQARVMQPSAAPVYSLSALALAPVTLSTAPRPVRGPAVRPAGVAGSFYPGEASQLTGMIDSLLAGERRHEAWPAALLPHAGLNFSGRIAANVLRRIRIPRTVIVLGPKHTPAGVDWAVAPHQTWTFPGGQLASDPVLAQQLADAIPGLEMDALAHEREHAIEVEIPFLARLAPQTRVVGVAIGAGDLQSCRRFAAGLAVVIKEQAEPPLLLISSDMNHYAADAENRRLDALALAALERLDPAHLYETVTQNNISMCGVLPAVIVMETLRLLGSLTRAERLDYATSADVNGDTSRVVGYAGMLFG